MNQGQQGQTAIRDRLRSNPFSLPLISRNIGSGIRAILAILFTSAGVFGDIIQLGRDDLPPNVPPSACDSILVAVYPPAPAYPKRSISERKTCVVWFRLSVGEGGVVKDLELLDCDAPGYGFEEEATRAMREARFRPAWEGIYPKLIWGYYPVTFSRPREWYQATVNQPNDIFGLGLDAPVVTPLESVAPAYPEKAADGLLEAEVILRLLINERGKAVNVRDRICSNPGFGFEEAAREAAKTAVFPQKKVPKRAEYSAYQVVQFRLSDGQIKKKGLPILSDSLAVDAAPAVQWQKAKVLPLEVLQKRLSGTVKLATLIDSTGRNVTVRLLESSGHRLLDSIAVDGSYQRKYQPAMKNGSAVSAWDCFDVPYFDFSTNVDSSSDATIEETQSDIDGEETTPGFGPSSYVDVDEPDIQAKFSLYEKAKYPLDLEETGIEGTVKLAALIDKDGSVLDTRLVRPSGFAEFDSAALAAVPLHRFNPGTTDDQPVRSWASWVVKFREGSKDVLSNDTSRTIVKPQIVSIHEPEYPANAFQAGIEGTVWLLLYVDTSGSVVDSKILQSSGTPALDLAALGAAPLHKFTPATVDGIPRNFWLRYRVDFEIKDRGN